MTTETTTATDIAVVRAGFEAFASGDIAGFADMFRARRDLEPPQRRPPRRRSTRAATGSWPSSASRPSSPPARSAPMPQAIMGDGAGPRRRVRARERHASRRPDVRRPADPALHGRGRPRPERRPVRRRPERRDGVLGLEIDSTSPAPGHAAGVACRVLVGLRLRTVASRRPRSRRYFNQYRRSLRPCDARFSPPRTSRGRGINHLASLRYLAKRFRTRKSTFAGLSARRRMRYGYHSGPYGVATSTLKPRAARSRWSCGRTP